MGGGVHVSNALHQAAANNISRHGATAAQQWSLLLSTLPPAAPAAPAALPPPRPPAPLPPPPPPAAGTTLAPRRRAAARPLTVLRASLTGCQRSTGALAGSITTQRSSKRTAAHQLPLWGVGVGVMVTRCL